MTFLVLNRRRILDELLAWFPVPEELVVLTAPGPTRYADVERLRRRLRHFEVREDYTGPGADARIEELCRVYGVCAILHTAEVDIVRAARIGARLGLRGQSVESATAYRNKYVMKCHAAAQGVPVAPMCLVDCATDLEAFAGAYGFPVVVKPIDGAAGAGMAVLGDRTELARLVAGWPGGRPAERVLAEAWVDGDMFHVDGLMHAGSVLVSWPSRYLYPQWDSKHHSMSFLSGMLAPGDPLFPVLQAGTAAVVAALPGSVVPLPFHAEFFHGGQGTVFCEIASRAGGGEIVEMFQRAFGVNLYEAGLKGQAGRFDEIRWRTEPLRHGEGWFMTREGVLAELPEHCPMPSVRSYTLDGKAGETYARPRSLGDIVARIVFTLDGEDTVAQLRAYDDWWNRSARWAPVS